jgi:hypothetical protein
MFPSNNFDDRHDRDSTWLPPRPRYSNVHVPGATERWVEYVNNQTRPMNPPDVRGLELYKNYSFYHDNGQIWVYPSDATQNEVGDGSGNARRTGGNPRQLRQRHQSSSSSESGDHGSPSLMEDWNALSFHWMQPSGGFSGVSHACYRAPQDTLQAERPNQAQTLAQLLPRRYHATQDRWTMDNSRGGLVGDIAILVALIAYGRPPNDVRNALVHSLRQPYRDHQHALGTGCM